MDKGNIAAVLVKLDINDQQALFIMLSSDGSINRLGTGSASNKEHDLFIGKTEPKVFRQLHGSITPELIQWCGQSMCDPEPIGDNCYLNVGFKEADGKEYMMKWQYGADSQGPPPEVCEFVLTSIKATNPWYEQQKSMVDSAQPIKPRKWWQLWQ